MIKVKLSDGSMAGFPDGMSPEDMMKVIAGQFPRRQAPAPANPSQVRQMIASGNLADLNTYAVNQGFPNSQAMMENLAGGKIDAGRAGLQGVTFGFGDEFLAAVRAGKLADHPTGEGYEEALEKERAVAEYYQAARPLEAGAAEIGFGTMIAAPPVAKGLQGAQSLLGGLGRAAAGGAAVGGLAGAGTGEGLQGRAEAAGQGAAMGTVLGPAAYGAAHPFQKAANILIPITARLGRRVANMMGLGLEKEGRRRGQEYIQNALARHGMSPQEAAAFLTDAENKGVKLVAADLTPEVVSYMTTLPSRGQVLLRDMLEERATQLGPRLEKKINRSLGLSDNVLRDIKDMRKSQMNQAAQDYPEAYAVEIEATPAMKNLLSRPSMKKGIHQAKLQAKEESRKLPKKDQFDMQAWDRVKRGLDRAIERETHPLTGKMTPEGRDIYRTKRELLEELDRINPAYANARQNYASKEEMFQAINEGRRLGRIDPDEFEMQLEAMTAAQKQYFRYGAAKALIDKARSGREGANLVNKIINNRKIEMVLEQAFPSPGEYAKFKELMKLEAMTAQTRSRLYGSPTAERLAGLEDIARQPTIGQEVAQDIAGTAHRKLSELQADEIARILQAGPQRLRQIYRQPERELMRSILEVARGAPVAGAALAGVE